jgi:two-component system phosphate regulon response regulator PhoB
MINDILVVDDDSATVEFLIEALQEEGYLCCGAYDGESAVLAIETARPALVLLDFHLPGLSGADVVAQLRRHDLAHVPIVLMTADAAAAAQLPTTTFPECLLKPFDLNMLLACIGRYVRPHRPARSLTADLTAPTGATNR